MQFDPYYKWLGIPADQQPPNHYRLLGLPLFDDDPEVIEHAADQRMSHIRTFQAGKRSQYAQKILNELSAARLVLLNPESKKTYDDRLKTELAASDPKTTEHDQANPVTNETMSVSVDDADPPNLGTSFSIKTPSKPIRRNSNPPWLLAALLGGAAIAVAMLVGLVMFLQGTGSESNSNSSNDSNNSEQVSQVDAPNSTQTNQDDDDRSNGANDLRQDEQDSTGTQLVSATMPASPFALRIHPRSYLELTNTTGLITRDGPFTVECWLRCKPEMLMTLVGDRALGNQHPDIAAGDERGWNMTVFPNMEQVLVIALQKGGLGFHNAQDFQWFHLALSSDGTTLSMYENGRLRTNRDDQWEQGLTNIYIGDGPYFRRPGLVNTTSLFDIAAFRISNSHRYPTEFTVPSEFAADDDTIVLLDFSNPSANQIRDMSGNGHHGQIVDAEWFDLSLERPVSND